MVNPNQYDSSHPSVAGPEGLQLAKDAIKQSDDNDSRLEQLELKVKHLSIINEALYDLLAARAKLSEAELITAMAQVQVNRKIRLEAKLTCASCAMQVPASRQKCMYCGGHLLGEVSVSPFDI